MVYYGDEDVMTPGGHRVALGTSVFGFTGSWDDASSIYIASVVKGTDSPTNRALFFAAADSILNGEATP